MLTSRLQRFLGLGRGKRDDGGPSLQIVGGKPNSVWCLDFLTFRDDRLLLDGWALVPAGQRPTLTVNGVAAACSFGQSRPDLQRVMSADDRAPTAGFHAEVTATVAQGAASLEIRLCDAQTLRPFVRGHSFFWPLGAPQRPLPDPARRKRVHGDENLDGFVINGYSTFRKLTEVLETRSKGWNDLARILDWGCGCGRVFRHLPAPALTRLVGIDIDEDNIGWCAQNFPDARFHTVALLPPTPFPAGTFDLVVGISVMTHLREGPQAAWLAELARICKPGALLLITVLGPLAAARANLSAEQQLQLKNEKFIATGPNFDLQGAIADADYYVNAVHTHAYVRTEWGKHFEILEICPGLIANHQDLVVMRRR